MALRISFGLFVASAVALAVASRAQAQGSKLEGAPSVAPAARRPAGELVRLALESEVAGNDRRRDALLREARYARPEDASVHWQLGEAADRGPLAIPARGRAFGQRGQAPCRVLRGGATRRGPRPPTMPPWRGGAGRTGWISSSARSGAPSCARNRPTPKRSRR